MRSRALVSAPPTRGLRTRARDWLGVAVEGIALVAAGSGATLAAFLGKALLAALLGGFAFAALMRLSLRRSRVRASQGLPSSPWPRPVAVLLSVIECAALVEAVKLPVRMDQPQFQYSHWLLVGVFLALAYFAQVRLLDGVARRLAR